MKNNQLQVFSNNEFGEVRTIIQNEEIWFVAKDISNILNYSETSKMLRRLDEEEKVKVEPTILGDSNSKAREITIINESGLYNAILGCKKPEAKKFKRWVTSEVLPSLRKNGTYSITTQQPNNMVANLVQSTMTAILPVITEQMAKVTVQNQQQINQMAVLIHDQADIYDQDRERIKELVGFKTANTSRIVKDIKEKLSDKMGYKIMANNNIFKKVKKEVFKEFKVVKWEDIPVEKYNAVYAFVDTYIDDMNV